MPRTPKLCHHKRSNRAYVTIEGKQHYLGHWDTDEAKLAYHELIKYWLENGRQLPEVAPSEPDEGDIQAASADTVTIAELIIKYVKHANGYYVKNGKTTDELAAIKSALRKLNSLYGTLEAIEFGPKKLQVVRSAMIEADWSRKHINKQVGRIKRLFRWAVKEELIPGSVFQNLESLEGLKAGRTEARETGDVRPIGLDVVEKTLEEMQKIPADVVRIQLLTGCRPGEACLLKPADIDCTGDVWIFTPESHKTKHHEKRRIIAIGPEAQQILKPYLLRAPDCYCFNPQEANEQRRREARLERKRPLKYEYRDRKSKPKRTAGLKYTTDSYRRAIHRACETAGVEKWAPNRLRHTTATEIRKRFGIEGAQVVLGHARLDTTQIYAEANKQQAINIAKQIG